MIQNSIKDLALAPEGVRKIDWVRRHMPLLNAIEKRFSEQQPFAGKRVAVSVHLEAKTAYLCQVLKAGGAEVFVTGSNQLSTQDDIAAALATEGMNVYAWYNATDEQYNEHLLMTLACKPHVIVDDGGDFTHILHETHPELAENLIGGSEETTTGVLRLKARQRAGKLNFPMISVNDADSKHLFDNRYGTGQSSWSGIMGTTNLSIAGKTVVVAGYGWCGKGVARVARGLGANIIVTEIDPVCAMEAIMDGYAAMTMDEAAPKGDVFITVTGCNRVITKRHFEKMKDGVILANAGHFDVEIDKTDLRALATEVRVMRRNVEGYVMADGRVLNLLAEGRLVNLAAGDGHPAEIMDMSFALQALCAEYLVENGAGLKNALYPVPREIDRQVASLALEAMGGGLDVLTDEQVAYLGQEGE